MGGAVLIAVWGGAQSGPARPAWALLLAQGAGMQHGAALQMQRALAVRLGCGKAGQCATPQASWLDVTHGVTAGNRRQVGCGDVSAREDETMGEIQNMLDRDQARGSMLVP